MGNKITLGLILITLGIFFYFNFVKEDVVVKDSLTVSTTTTNILGKNIAKALNQIESLSLDTTIFSEPGYKRLVPSEQEIPILPWGKNSPFDPIDWEGIGESVAEEEVLIEEVNFEDEDMSEEDSIIEDELEQ